MFKIQGDNLFLFTIPPKQGPFFNNKLGRMHLIGAKDGSIKTPSPATSLSGRCFAAAHFPTTTKGCQ